MRWRVPLWILGVGLLPLWASIAVVFIGSMGRTAEYWNVAPWLVIAAIPSCAVSMTIAGITYAVYRATEGGQNRKLARAAAALAFMLAIVVAGAGILWKRESAKNSDIRANELAGQAIVESSPFVARQAPANFRVSLNSSLRGQDGQPISFTYYVSSVERPADSLMAIVRVSQPPSEPRLRFECVIQVREYQNLQSGQDPCRSGKELKP